MGKKVIFIDYTHMDNRAVSGIERVSEILFTNFSLDGADVRYVRGGSLWRIMLQQWIGLPILLLLNRNAYLICPGFPPSPIVTLFFRRRLFVYIYDLFLLNRKSDLNWRARIYMRPSFVFALARAKNFFALTQTVAHQLSEYVSDDAVIQPWRPRVDNVFALSAQKCGTSAKGFKIVSIGTVEPRKNYITAAQICDALSRKTGTPVEFCIIGRKGWGADFELLQTMPWVRLLGFQDDDEIRKHIETADCFLYVPHDEGLGLPAVEVQYGGVLVVASDIPIFQEVLENSAVFIDPSDVEAAASKIAASLACVSRDGESVFQARQNVDRWNSLADCDGIKVGRIFQGLFN